MISTGPRASVRVLLVEDSPRIAERLRDLLENEAGASVVHIAVDEEGAIRAARNNDIDVMVLDLQLQRGTGFGVLRALGSTRPTTIVMTSFVAPQYRAKAVQLGAAYFLDKAVDLDRLPDIIAEVSRAVGP